MSDEYQTLAKFTCKQVRPLARLIRGQSHASIVQIVLAASMNGAARAMAAEFKDDVREVMDDTTKAAFIDALLGDMKQTLTETLILDL